MGSRSQDFWDISWTTVCLVFCFFVFCCYCFVVVVVVVVFIYLFFCTVFTYKLKLCKDCAREFNRVSGDSSVRVTAASDLFNLMYKEFIELIRKKLWGNI